MENAEQNVRNYLKTLSVNDINNSGYFIGVDFDTVPIESIMRKLDSLYEEIQLLKEMINNNFQSVDGYPAPEPLARLKIIEDYRRKQSTLVKILYNEDIYNMFIRYKNGKEKQPSVPTSIQI